MTVVTSIVWPAVVVFVVVVLKRELAGLVGRVSRLSVPGAEAEFAAEVTATAQIAEAMLPDPPNEVSVSQGEPLTPQPQLSDLKAEAARHPVGAIVRAWNRIEELPWFRPGRNVSQQTMRDLLIYPEVGDEMWSVYRRLYDLRSQVVHGRVIPTVSDADEFVEASWRLLAYIAQVLAVYPEKATVGVHDGRSLFDTAGGAERGE